MLVCKQVYKLERLMHRLPERSFLDKALDEACIPALMMSMVHMSGDTHALERWPNPQPQQMLEKMDGGLNFEQLAALKHEAIDQIADFHNSGAKATMSFAPETLASMLSFAVGEDSVASNYSDMMLEELAITGVDAKRVDIEPAAVAQSSARVVIIGAGMSGLLLAMRLQQAGIDYLILEKNAGVGGTWFENRYPGCRVDIASHAYSFSFEHDYQWAQLFGQHDQLREYFNKFANKHQLLKNIRFNTEVTQLSYDDTSCLWNINSTKNGESHSLQANLVVSAVGQLNRPSLPDIAGINEFQGTQLHSAQWDEHAELEGKKIVVVGSGATAFQMVPELAKHAASLTVFQRTAQWMIPNPDYHESISVEHLWLFEHLPGYARWYRILSLWPMLDKSKPTVTIEEGWDDGGLSCGQWNALLRENLHSYIASQVDDPALLSQVIPNYPPMGTRVLQDNGSWLSTLQQANVELVSEAVTQVTATGVVGADGTEVSADLIVWATGFQTDRFVWPMQVTGRDGITLDDAWAETPSAFLGMAVPGFPNFFCLYGPNSNVAHTANVILISECQVRYVMNALKLFLENRLSEIECKQEVASDYEQRLDSALSKMVWSHPSVQGFYRLGSTGRVVVNMPWDAVEYWQWTKELNRCDFETH